MLFYALARCDTNELSHRLLDRFGSFSGLLEAEQHELCDVPGIGENTAILISLVTEMNKRYLKSEKRVGKKISSSDDAGEFLKPYFTYEKQEHAYILSLTTAGNVIRCRKLGSGLVNKVDFSARDVVELVMKDNAAGVILAHNHLSDTALPSAQDLSATKMLRTALALIGVKLIDHVIVCGADFVSMRDSGYFLNFGHLALLCDKHHAIAWLATLTCVMNTR